jgi:hypothetical protein
MQRGLPIVAAITWLAFLAMVIVMDHARMETASLVLTSIGATGFCLALVLAFTRQRWVIWASLLVSIPGALWSYVWFFYAISLLRISYSPLGRRGHAESALGYTSFQWFCLLVTVFVLTLPVLWVRQLRRRTKV